MEHARVLRRQLGEIAEELEEQPCRRVPSGRANRPGVHADEVEITPGELVTAAVQGVELEVPVGAGRRGVGAAGVRGERLDRVQTARSGLYDGVNTS